MPVIPPTREAEPEEERGNPGEKYLEFKLRKEDSRAATELRVRRGRGRGGRGGGVGSQRAHRIAGGLWLPPVISFQLMCFALHFGELRVRVCQAVSKYKESVLYLTICIQLPKNKLITLLPHARLRLLPVLAGFLPRNWIGSHTKEPSNSSIALPISSRHNDNTVFINGSKTLSVSPDSSVGRASDF
ncbi:uncharacterized protein LOC126936421 [Macaca thibetana thibetana]|uniref:uncharacterized protein LOC126936421 n=1 Tax=Macaca thibetana thibetana TaxID=257877 RepID=UPI0021BCA701|nr:uncharacterized protein LOC126936421 [Macaca thibetana thibetana]